MTNPLMHIHCEKSGTSSVYYVEDRMLTLAEICEAIEQSDCPIVSFETVENGRTLLAGYVCYQNRSSFERQLTRAAKAKVKI